MPCASCTDETRCDRAGLCQTFARQQLQREEKTETVTWRPATATNLPDADETVLIACDTQFHSEPVWLGFHDGKGWREAGGEPAFVTHWARMLAGPHGVMAVAPALPSEQEIDAVRATFEDHARKNFQWERFERDSDGTYRNANVRSAWYWLRMGFAASGVAGTQGGEQQ